MKTYTLYNQSTVVSSTSLQKIVTAMNSFLTVLCADWSLAPIQIASATYRGALGNNSIIILDNTDEPGALGYHYESNGNAIAKVFAKTIVNYGGAVLYRDQYTFTVAQCICHELLEMIGNSQINRWYLDNNGIFWAGELCDPVESNLITYTLSGNVKVGLSDYVLPNWFSPDSSSGPYNKLNTLRQPFTLDSGGYAIIIDNYEIIAIYGSTHPSGTQSLVSINASTIQGDVNELKEKFKFKH